MSKQEQNHTDILRKILPELGKLEELEGYLEEVHLRLEQIYASKFPKTCQSCHTTYPNREAYLAATQKIQREKYPDGNIFQAGQVAEFRNCPCGSTLLVLSPCRRDGSEHGKRRRELFNQCREKLVSSFDVPEEAAGYVTRFLFQLHSSWIRKKMEKIPLD